MTEILHKEDVYRIIGCAFEVYNELGAGFLEPVYQEAFERELNRQNIPFESQKRLQIFYKGEPLTKEYIADLIVIGQIIVELKARTLSNRAMRPNSSTTSRRLACGSAC